MQTCLIMWKDVVQNSDEWFDLRVGKITSSHFASIMANDGKALGNPAIEYAQRVALEQVTGLRDETGSFKNAYMDRGNDLEPIARDLYEIETFSKVTNGGFHYIDDLGDSPDGKVGEKGRIEIKCVIPNTHWKRLKKGGYDTAYKYQIQGHLWIGNCDWCDFVQYCPEMPQSKRLYVFTVKRDEEMIERMKIRMELFRQEVKKNVEILNA